MNSKIYSGMGSERDNELRGGCRLNTRTFTVGSIVSAPGFPWGSAKTFGTRISSAEVSLKQGKVVPLDPSLEFAGIIEGVGEESGAYLASVTTRGAIHIKVTGLSPETREGSRVYALPGKRTLSLPGTTDHTGAWTPMTYVIAAIEACAIRSSLHAKAQSHTGPFVLH